jgi:SAM-dependent methyltransferase
MATHQNVASRSGGAPREDADIEASAPEYALRFSGPVGRWFIESQTRLTLECLDGLPAGSTILDVGGGHAQVAPPLSEAGYRVTVAGSDPICGELLGPWTSTGAVKFDVADLQNLPYAGPSFDAVVCYRLMAHSIDWMRLIAELCRVARYRVIVEYPSRRSVNLIADALYGLKRSIEGATTRRFALYRPREVSDAFQRAGFAVVQERPQFIFPMVLYRMIASVHLARAAEFPPRLLGLTRRFGSPVIARADRVAPSL